MVSFQILRLTNIYLSDPDFISLKQAEQEDWEAWAIKLDKVCYYYTGNSLLSPVWS